MFKAQANPLKSETDNTGLVKNGPEIKDQYPNRPPQAANLHMGQVKVKSADTERGEAGINLPTNMVEAAKSKKHLAQGGIVPKGNLSMAGGAIMDDSKPQIPSMGSFKKKNDVSVEDKSSNRSEKNETSKF